MNRFGLGGIPLACKCGKVHTSLEFHCEEIEKKVMARALKKATAELFELLCKALYIEDKIRQYTHISKAETIRVPKGKLKGGHFTRLKSGYPDIYKEVNDVRDPDPDSYVEIPLTIWIEGHEGL